MNCYNINISNPPHVTHTMVLLKCSCLFLGTQLTTMMVIDC